MTEAFKKMGCVCKRRGDGVWYYMEVRATEVEKKEEDPDEGYTPVADGDLPF